jgi:DNA-binding CsgD family transcriptional regulator
LQGTVDGIDQPMVMRRRCRRVLFFRLPSLAGPANNGAATGGGCGSKQGWKNMVKTLKEWQMRLMLGGIGVVSFGLLMALEILTETDEIDLTDILVDGLGLLLMVSTTVGLALLFNRMQMQHEEKLDLIRSLDVARTEGTAWRKKAQAHLEGLRNEMDTQFERWGMSAAEKEIGMLILKGLSHKEIARLRGTGEATVRQQAQSIYQKSDLPGKTAFSAYFLEDLISPEIPEVRPEMRAKTQVEARTTVRPDLVQNVN